MASKYKNKEVIVNGIKFDSIKESNRYLVLLNYQKIGSISNLEVQKTFVLVPKVNFSDGTFKRSMRYIADFVYIDTQTGAVIVEDVKSDVTRKLQSYRDRKHMMKAFLDIDIKEV